MLSNAKKRAKALAFMNPQPSPKSPFRSFFRNWISFAGIIIVLASILAFLLLITLDYFAEDDSPYLGVLTYLIVPATLFFGLFVVFVGFLLQRRQMARSKTGEISPILSIDLNRPRDRRMLGAFLFLSLFLFLVTAIASYQTYHITKTVQFCGETCHEIMKPQYITAQHSPHARVECTACHVGPEAVSYVKSKFNGLRQVYVALKGDFKGPIVAHDKIQINQKTCEQCHWPDRYVGNRDRTFNHFLDDDDNTPYSVRLSLKVGGGDPTHGPVGGIHWHMNVNNKVEYIATDEMRQKIPWIRLTDASGKVTEFRTAGFKDDPQQHTIHTMDCMDCHSRPAHHFRAPNDAVDLAMSAGRISTKLPAIKKAAVNSLTKEYKTQAEALQAIAATLREKYSGHADVEATIKEVQHIYSIYFFPEMNTHWKLRPNNIGHKDSPGCFRCHDNEHVSTDGMRTLGNKDCNQCHTILAEGRGEEFEKLSSAGLTFMHPEEGWDDLNCYDCHNGSMDD